MSIHFIFSKPKDFSIFEDIVCDLFSSKYQYNNFQCFARNGQSPNRADIASSRLTEEQGIIIGLNTFVINISEGHFP